MCFILVPFFFFFLLLYIGRGKAVVVNIQTVCSKDGVYMRGEKNYWVSLTASSFCDALFRSKQYYCHEVHQHITNNH